MHIGATPRRQRQFGRLVAVEQADQQPRILVDRHRAVGAVGAGHQAQAAALVGGVEALFLVAGGNAAHVRLDPDLQEMGLGLAGMVELGVADAAAGAHALHIARPDHAAIADAVLVAQFAFQHIGDDFHVAVAMGAKAAAGRDTVFIDHAQRAEAHMLRIVVVGERKAVPGIQPSMVGMTALIGLAYLIHLVAPCLDVD